MADPKTPREAPKADPRDKPLPEAKNGHVSGPAGQGAYAEPGKDCPPRKPGRDGRD